ncbi:MAG: 5'-methylthioadenosine/adenosylhomocysteine nucleosidase [Neisseriales bacterium]|nr:MAG: 5'-methylthioadenosine/adenosylhomocysteine nucleosidase [Neisseriales bacterium]
MILGVICAMQEELDEITKELALTPVNQIDLCSNSYFVYTYGSHTIVAGVCGIGKVNAAVTTQLMIDKFTPDKIINVGVAGSLSQNLVFGDVVIAEDLVQHDFDITPFGVRLGQIARMDTFSFPTDSSVNKLILDNLALPENKIVLGRIVSGDQFIDDKNKAEFLAKEFDALACEMEGAAIAHVCYLNKLPVCVIRSLSDMAGQDGQAIHSFNDLKFMAAARAAKVVVNLLEHI